MRTSLRRLGFVLGSIGLAAVPGSPAEAGPSAGISYLDSGSGCAEPARDPRA